jgi:hypothetical protein
VQIAPSSMPVPVPGAVGDDPLPLTQSRSTSASSGISSVPSLSSSSTAAGEPVTLGNPVRGALSLCCSSVVIFSTCLYCISLLLLLLLSDNALYWFC